MLLVIAATAALMIAINAMYVAAEFAAVASRKPRVSQMAGQQNRFAAMLLPVMEDSRKLDTYIAAAQLGITASSLVLGAYGQNVAATYLAPRLAGLGWFAGAAAESIAATFMLLLFTTLQVVLGELFPKSIAIQYPERVALATVLPMRWSQILLRPFIWFFNGSGLLLLRLMGQAQHGEHNGAHSAEEIELLVSETAQLGLLDATERQLLRNALRLRDLMARQVMVPRIRLAMAPVDSTVEEIIELAVDEGFSRIPVYEDSVDNVIGFVHIKDLFVLYRQGHTNPREVLREVLFFPETRDVSDVWDEMRQQHKYIAVVFDEYGGTAGLITLEDLIEEIVGELQDEFDDETALTFIDQRGRLHLRGDLLVNDVNEYLDLELPDDEADTLGGLVFNALGQAPKVGDEATFGETVIIVEAVDGLTITDVSLVVQEGMNTSVVEWESDSEPDADDHDQEAADA